MKEGWKYKKLGEVCDIIGGGTPSKKNTAYYEGNIPWATVRDMNCNVLSKTEFKISEEGFNDSASHIIKKGEIIIATRVGLGKVCKLAQDTAINQDLKGIIPKKYDIIRDFIFYFFKSRAKFIEENGVGATVKGVKIKFVEDLLFPIIPLKEQQRIVSRLDAAFSHIDKLKANAEKQLSEARALFQKSLAKAMEPKEGWEVKTLKEVCSVITDGTHHSPTNLPTGKYKYITAKNIKPWGLDLSNITYVSEDVHREIVARCNPQKGDVLYIKDGATTGIAIINPLDEEISILSSVALIRPQKSILLSKYLCYALNSPSIYEQTRNQMDGAAITRVTLVKIKGFSIPLPSLSEQQRIVERLDALSAHVRELEENQKKIISECDALKQALLRKVFE
ncbi:MAG: restriction endonuclease subunit S [Prevotella sp.]|nr:restriction endonuclease subunit S [Prevotella sp.]